MSVELQASEAKGAQGVWRLPTYRSLIEDWRQERGSMPRDSLRKALLFTLATGRMRRMRPGWGC